MNICRYIFLNFPIFSQCFQMRFSSRWKWIFKNRKRFLFLISSVTKTSLMFVTYIMVWNIQRYYMTLFFRISGGKSLKAVSDLDATSSNKSCNQIRIALLCHQQCIKIVPSRFISFECPIFQLYSCNTVWDICNKYWYFFKIF